MSTSHSLKACPFCAESIPMEAVVCPLCHRTMRSGGSAPFSVPPVMASSALVPCRHCAKDIARAASTCPHCGGPGPNTEGFFFRKGSELPKILVGAVIVMLLFGGIWIPWSRLLYPSAEKVAKEVEPGIRKEAKKRTKLENISGGSVTLIHKEGKTYVGFVDFKVTRKSEIGPVEEDMRLYLEVVYDQGKFFWQLKQ